MVTKEIPYRQREVDSTTRGARCSGGSAYIRRHGLYQPVGQRRTQEGQVTVYADGGDAHIARIDVTAGDRTYHRNYPDAWDNGEAPQGDLATRVDDVVAVFVTDPPVVRLTKLLRVQRCLAGAYSAPDELSRQALLDEAANLFDELGHIGWPPPWLLKLNPTRLD